MADVIQIPTPTFAGRISLKTIRELPRDTFLVSNVLCAEGPAMMVRIAVEEPEVVYAWIKENHLQGRLFYGFASQLDYELWEQCRMRSMA